MTGRERKSAGTEVDQQGCDAIRRDGIPYEIIAETLPYLEEEINNTLSQMVEYEIEFDVDGKNILTYIKMMQKLTGYLLILI